MLKGEYIELNKLLKLVHLANTGGHAKLMVEEGIVFLNGKLEQRKRAKIKAGDKVEVNGNTILIST